MAACGGGAHVAPGHSTGLYSERILRFHDTGLALSLHQLRPPNLTVEAPFVLQSHTAELLPISLFRRARLRAGLPWAATAA
jgi:hypothetical protein